MSQPSGTYRDRLQVNLLSFPLRRLIEICAESSRSEPGNVSLASCLRSFTLLILAGIAAECLRSALFPLPKWPRGTRFRSPNRLLHLYVHGALGPVRLFLPCSLETHLRLISNVIS